MNVPGAALARAVAVMAALVTTLGAPSARAAEPVYDPPAGSRWIVETETRGEEIRPEGSTGRGL